MLEDFSHIFTVDNLGFFYFFSLRETEVDAWDLILRLIEHKRGIRMYELVLFIHLHLRGSARIRYGFCGTMDGHHKA